MVNKELNEFLQSSDPLQCREFYTFLTTFNIQLVHRFPSVTDFVSLDSNSIRDIAEFSAAVTVIAQNVWDDITQIQRKSGTGARQTRAA